MVRGRIRGRDNDISDRCRARPVSRRSASPTRASGASISTIRPARRCRRRWPTPSRNACSRPTPISAASSPRRSPRRRWSTTRTRRWPISSAPATPEEVIIGANMTTLTYHMSRTLGRGFAPGDEIIVTRMDHEGNVSPWLQLAEDRGLTVRFLPFDTSTAGRSRRTTSGSCSTTRTQLVALNYASNLTGSINPVKQLVRLAKRGRRADLCRRRAVRAARAGRRRRTSAAISSPARPTNSSGRIWASCGAGAT